VLFGIGKSKNLVGPRHRFLRHQARRAQGGQGGFSLVKAGVEYLSSEAIVDGAIMDASLVVDTISKLNSAQGVKNANYGTSVSATRSSSRRSVFRR